MVGSSVFSSISNYFNGISSQNRHASSSAFSTSSPSTDTPRRPSPLRPLANYYSQDSLSSPYSSNAGENQSSTALAPSGRTSSPRPTSDYASEQYYSPGLRSAQAAVAARTSIPLQEFGADGSAPPPPVVDSWRRIDKWAEENYPELLDQLSYPATQADVDDLERELDCTLPRDVRESFLLHDGQERGGAPTGIFFGIPLLDCEEVIEEWNIWKCVAAEEAKSLRRGKRHSVIGDQSQQRQSSVPEAAIRRVYSHLAWIPLGKDFCGNNVGIDLAPGPNGRWGQVILFGRDQDIKYVIAKSWASLLATIANDLEAGNWCIDDVSGELRLIDNRVRAEDESFFEIMKARVRLRESRKKSLSPLSSGAPRSANDDVPSSSPFNSPSVVSRLNDNTSLSNHVDTKLVSPLTTSPSPSVAAASTLLSVIEEAEIETAEVPEPRRDLVLGKTPIEVPTISVESNEDGVGVQELQVSDLSTSPPVIVDGNERDDCPAINLPEMENHSIENSQIDVPPDPAMADIKP